MLFADVSPVPSLLSTLVLLLTGAILLIVALSRVGRAISITRTRRALERYGSSTSGEVTGVRFKALNRFGKPYGLVSFIYSVDGNRYTGKQAVDEATAQSLLRERRSAHVLYLPATPRVAKLGSVFSDVPVVLTDPTTKLLLYLLLVVPLALIALGVGIWMVLSLS